MKLGLLTACMPEATFAEAARWAAGHGYQALEAAAWPRRAEGQYHASHLDVAAFDAGEARRTRDLLDQHGLTLSALAYYENNLHQDPEERARVNAHLRRCVDAAALLECELVGTFVGRDLSLPVAENLRLAEEVFPPLATYARDRGVRLMVENCPMEGWHPDGCPANVAYSPELWDWLAELGLWLNFDPSHLVWLGVDPLRALAGHVGRVAHVQAKDVEVDAAARDRYSVFGRVIGREPWSSGWWRYRVPGCGQVDWAGVVDTLRASGYDGVVSVEHEDPVWGGTPEKVREGLEIARRTLSPLIAT